MSDDPVKQCYFRRSMDLERSGIGRNCSCALHTFMRLCQFASDYCWWELQRMYDTYFPNGAFTNGGLVWQSSPPIVLYNGHPVILQGGQIFLYFGDGAAGYSGGSNFNSGRNFNASGTQMNGDVDVRSGNFNQRDAFTYFSNINYG